jgi:large subunit ribosomal protein L6
VVSGDTESRESRQFHGLTRALVANMIAGVTLGYEKKLEIVGVGYLAAIQGETLQLRVGFANELHKKIPKDLKVTCPDQTHIVIKGCDKQRVGQFAAEIRSLRKPEPYKGKGVRYQGEQVKIKPGKSATK